MPDLITLEDVKIFLNVASGSTTHDALLKLLIEQYSAVIEGYCRRKFSQDNYEEVYDGNGKTSLLLDNYPIISIESLTIDDYPYTASDYLIYKNEGEIKLVEDAFAIGNQNVEIEYTAGFEEVPADIKLCCTEMTASKFKEIDGNRIGIASISFGDQNTTFRESEFTDKIKNILNRYRKPVL